MSNNMTIPTTSSSTLQEQIDQLTEEMYGKLPTITTPPPNPIDSLPQQRKIQLAEFEKHIRQTAWCTKYTQTSQDVDTVMNNSLTYYRYLKGYEWKRDVAEAKLKGMCEWRLKEKPNELTMEKLKIIGQTRLMQCYGFDKHHRPIIYVNMGQLDKDKNWDSDEKLLLKFKYCVYITEIAIERMSKAHPHVFQQVWIVDMNDSNLGLATVKKCKDLFLGLGDYHPERLHSAIICNTGWTLSILFNFLKYFLTEEMVAKYKFIKKGNDDELAKVLTDLMDTKKYLLDGLRGPIRNVHNVEKIMALEKLKRQLELQKQQEQQEKLNELKQEQSAAVQLEEATEQVQQDILNLVL